MGRLLFCAVFLYVCLFLLMNLNPVLLHSMHVCLCVLQLYQVFLDSLPPGLISVHSKEDYTSVAFSSLYSGAYHFKSNGHIMVKSPSHQQRKEKKRKSNNPDLLLFYR